MKKYQYLYNNLEKKLWGDKVRSNIYLASVTILLAGLCGVFGAGGDSVAMVLMGSANFTLSNYCGGILMLVMLWGLDVYESIVVSETSGIALRRSLLLLGIMLAAFALGILLSIVVIAIVAFVIGLFIMSGAFAAAFDSMTGSSSSSSSGPSCPQESGPQKYKITDENGCERILEDQGFGKFKDDRGDYWKSDGYGRVTRDI